MQPLDSKFPRIRPPPDRRPAGISRRRGPQVPRRTTGWGKPQQTGRTPCTGEDVGHQGVEERNFQQQRNGGKQSKQATRHGRSVAALHPREEAGTLSAGLVAQGRLGSGNCGAEGSQSARSTGSSEHGSAPDVSKGLQQNPSHSR